MNRPLIQINPVLGFNLHMSPEAIQAIHRGLTYAKEYGQFASDDPLIAITNAFSRVIKDLQNQNALMGVLSVNDAEVQKQTDPDPEEDQDPDEYDAEDDEYDDEDDLD
jgi:hypothetical protein